MLFLYQKTLFLYQKIFFLDPKTFFLYQKIFFLYQKTFFLYQKIFFLHQKIFFLYLKSLFLYQKSFFLVGRFVVWGCYGLMLGNEIFFYWGGIKNRCNLLRGIARLWLERNSFERQNEYFGIFFTLLQNELYIWNTYYRITPQEIKFYCCSNNKLIFIKFLKFKIWIIKTN